MGTRAPTSTDTSGYEVERVLVKVFHDIVIIATFLAGSEMLEGVRALLESRVG